MFKTSGRRIQNVFKTAQAFLRSYIIQSDRKTAQPTPNMYCLLINKLNWNKKCYIQYWKCPDLNKSWRMASKLSLLNTEDRLKQFLSCTLLPRTLGKCAPGLIQSSQVQRDDWQWSTINSRWTCEKDIFAPLLLKDHWRTGASGLHDTTYLDSCTVTGKRTYWTVNINKYG
jgi:hypothetical protein